MPHNDGVRALLASRTYLRLWAIGGCVNTMRSFEVLAAALFTLDVTGSGLAVAVVSAARTHADAAVGRVRRRDVGSREPQEHRAYRAVHVRARLSATIAVLAAFGRCPPVACRRGRAGGRHRVVHRDVNPSAHGWRVRGRRVGSARAGAGHRDQFDHAPDRTDGGRHGVSGSRAGRRIRNVRMRIFVCSSVLVAGLRLSADPAAGSYCRMCPASLPRRSRSRAAT